MMRSSEPFHHFVDDYLAYLHEVHPTGATLDGIHTYDDHIEDFSRHALEQHTRALSGFSRRLQEINVADLTAVEKAEQPMVAANIQSRMFELEQIRTWERSPQLYSDTLCSSLAAQVVFTHAPLPERARRVLSKLRQTARVVQAARDNIKDPPGIFVKVGLETLRGALNFIEKDLPRAFSPLDDMHLLGDLADASTEAVQAISSYVQYLEEEIAPKARGSFRLGQEMFERKLALDEGITVDADRLLTIALREFQATQDEFRSIAGKLDGGDPGYGVAQGEGGASRARGALSGRAAAARRAQHVHRSERHRVSPGRRTGDRCAHPGVLPVVVCEHVGPWTIRAEAGPGALLPH